MTHSERQIALAYTITLGRAENVPVESTELRVKVLVGLYVK